MHAEGMDLSSKHAGGIAEQLFLEELITVQYFLQGHNKVHCGTYDRNASQGDDTVLLYITGIHSKKLSITHKE